MRRLNQFRRQRPFEPKQRGDNWVFRTPGLVPVECLLAFVFLILASNLPTASLGGIIFLGALMVFCIWSGRRAWCGGITATPHEVRFVGILRTRRIRWEDIGKFEYGAVGDHRTTVQAVRKDGGVVSVRSFNAGNAYTKPETDQARFQPVLRKLTELLLEHRSTQEV